MAREPTTNAPTPIAARVNHDPFTSPAFVPAFGDFNVGCTCFDDGVSVFSASVTAPWREKRGTNMVNSWTEYNTCLQALVVYFG